MLIVFAHLQAQQAASHVIEHATQQAPREAVPASRLGDEDLVDPNLFRGDENLHEPEDAPRLDAHNLQHIACALLIVDRRVDAARPPVHELGVGVRRELSFEEVHGLPLDVESSLLVHGIVALFSHRRIHLIFEAVGVIVVVVVVHLR